MARLFTLTGTAELQEDGTMKVVGVLAPVAVPAQVQNLVLTGLTEDTASLAWDNAGDASSWEIYRDFVLLDTSVVPSYDDATLVAGNQYVYTVKAVSSAGTSELDSNSVNAAPVALPDVPAQPELTHDVVTRDFASFFWTNPGDAVTWDVYRDSVLLEADLTSADYVDNTVVDGVTYEYTVIAKNADGDSLESDPLTVLVPANAPPAWQLDETTIDGTVGDSYSLDLAANCDDADLDSITFSINSGSVPGLAVVNGTQLGGTLSTAGDFSVELKADDGDDFSLITLNFSVAALADTTPPSTPALGTPVVTGSSVSVPLATPSTDASGIFKYNVTRKAPGESSFSYRGTLFSEADFPYVESGLAAGTYGYKVRAFDNSPAQNQSTISDEVQAVVASINPNPDTPTSLAAVLISADDAKITWDAGLSGAAVTGYDLEYSIEADGGSATGPWQDFVVSGTVEEATHSNLPTGDVWYRIRALSATGASGYTSVIKLTVGQSSATPAFRIALGTTSWDGSVARATLNGTGTRAVQAGDIIEFAGGTFREFTLLKVKGNAQNPVELRCPSNAQVVFRRASVPQNGGGFLTQWKDCQHFVVNGFTTSNNVPVTRDGKRHGFKWTIAENATVSNKEQITAFVKFKGLKKAPVNGDPYTNSYNSTFRYCHFDGEWDAVPANSKSGDFGFICFDSNDHNYGRAMFPGQWQENMTWEHFLAENVGGEATYFGTNPYDTYKGPYVDHEGGVPLRGIKTRYFMIYNTGGQAIQYKSVLGGTNGGDGPLENSIHDGVIIRATSKISDATNGTPAIICNSSKADVYNCWIEGCGGGAITNTVSDGTNLFFPAGTSTTFQYRIYNNVIVDNNRLDSSFNGIRIASFTGSNPALPAAFKPIAHIFCNTILRHSGPAIKIESSSQATSSIENNIISESGAMSPGPVTPVGNLINSNASAIFVDPVGTYLAGNINLRLLVAQLASSVTLPPAGALPATWATNVNVPNFDHDGVVRQASPAPDKGAYEFA